MSASAYILAADTVERRLELGYVPGGWLALGSVALLLLLLYGVVFFYRREQRAGASLRLRLVLAGMRCGVLLLLAAIWLQPLIATYTRRKIQSHTLVLVDASASMSLKDRYPQADRAQLVEQALAGVDPRRSSRAELTENLLSAPGELIAKLAVNNPVHLFQFGGELEYLGEIEKQSQSAGASLKPPQGAATDIGRALRGAVELQSGAPIAGIVVLSDGRFNHGEPAEVVGRYARSRRVPIYTVGIGDPAPPRSVTVSSIEAPPNVFVKDPFKVTVNLRAEGLHGAPLTVQLLEQQSTATQPALVDSKQITVAPDGQVPPVVFNREIAAASEVTLHVRVVPEAGEVLEDVNPKQATVRALEARMRILVVSGGPTWEYRYITRLLERDATVNVSCWLQSADEEAVRDGTTIIDHLPQTQQELFQYDCIILLDPAPGEFDAAWISHVEALVGSYGGGLLYVAGRKNASRFAHDPGAAGLLNLLPVVIEPNESDLLINELGHFQTTAWPLAVPPEAAASAVLALSDVPGETAQIWPRLPGVYWHYPVRREKPVASVLLRHSNPRMRNSYGGHVLLATQFFGAGRTAFLGFDSTWRWRRYGDQYFNRFWIQLLRHLVEGKLLTGQKRGLIQVERETYSVGEPVIIEARLLDTRNLPMTAPQVQAGLQLQGQPDRTVVLDAQPNRPGWYRGQFVPTEAGTHGVRIDLPGGDGAAAATIRGEVRVGQPDLEFRQPQLDRESLATLAAQSAGGRYFEINEVEKLPPLIPSKTTTLVLTGQPVTLWDRWWTMAALTGLLAVEWALRKRAKLL